MIVHIHVHVHVRTARVDYQPLDRVTLSFEVSELRKCINITILEDNLEEGDVGEIFSVQILSVSSSSDEDDILINSNQLLVSILDSDGKYDRVHLLHRDLS